MGQNSNIWNSQYHKSSFPSARGQGFNFSTWNSRFFRIQPLIDLPTSVITSQDPTSAQFPQSFAPIHSMPQSTQGHLPGTPLIPPFFFLSLGLKVPFPVKASQDLSSSQQASQPWIPTACYHTGNRTIGSLRAANPATKGHGRGSRGLKLVGITNPRPLFFPLLKRQKNISLQESDNLRALVNELF